MRRCRFRSSVHHAFHLPASLRSTPVMALHRYYERSDLCTALAAAQGSLIHVLGLPTIPSPLTCASIGTFSHATLQLPMLPVAGSGFRHWLAGSPTAPAVSSSSLSYGLVVHLLLLPTLPRGNAVAFSYRPESVCLKRTSTSSTKHAFRRTSRGRKATVNGAYRNLSPAKRIHALFLCFRNYGRPLQGLCFLCGPRTRAFRPWLLTRRP